MSALSTMKNHKIFAKYQNFENHRIMSNIRISIIRKYTLNFDGLRKFLIETQINIYLFVLLTKLFEKRHSEASALSRM